MTPLAQNFSDQSATIASNLKKGEREIRFAPGYHRIAKSVVVPDGVKFSGYGATIDLAMDDWGFLLQGGLQIEGATIIGKPTLATGIGGSPSISFDRVDCSTRTTIQNIRTGGATNSTFRNTSMWKNCAIQNCTFAGDTYIGGAMQFNDNQMRGRLIANNETGGLNKAKIHRVRWDSWHYGHNNGECLLFEDCDVLDSEFSDLEYRGGCTTLMTWWVNQPSATFQCKRNLFQNITSDGPTCIGFRFFGGDVDGNLIRNASLHRITFPIMLENGCKANTIEYLYVIDCAPVVPQGGFEPWVWTTAIRFPKRYVISDDGESTKIKWLFVEGARGVPISRYMDRIEMLELR